MTQILTPEQVAGRKHSLFCSCGCDEVDDVLQDGYEALREQLVEAETAVWALVDAIPAFVNTSTLATWDKLQGALALPVVVRLLGAEKEIL